MAETTALSATGVVTVAMTPEVAGEVHQVLLEGYRGLRYGTQATPDWCLNVLRVIEDITDQLKAGGYCG